MRIDDFVDVDTVKALCRHTTTFIAGLGVTVLAKPAFWAYEQLSSAFGHPLHASVQWVISWGDDLLLAYFFMGLVIHFVRETKSIWKPLGTRIILLAVTYRWAAHHA